jgi:polyphosphate kinase
MNSQYTFIDRDLSWLSFNERVLYEAQRDTVPLLERFNFLAIYSSNLDEFYRVRMPVLMALHGHAPGINPDDFKKLLAKINKVILAQLKHFGSIIENKVVGALKQHKIHLIYNEPIPNELIGTIQDYFFYTVATYLQVVNITNDSKFFPENNKLYLAVATTGRNSGDQVYIISIPSDVLSRFYSISTSKKEYIIFLDDIIKINLRKIFVDQAILSSHSFKITRDAELDLEDEFSGNLARKIELKIRERDQGLATRFLYEPGIPPHTLELMMRQLNLKGANFIQGGTYHNLKDFASLPLKDPTFRYERWPQINFSIIHQSSLFDEIKVRDILLHPPYHSYETVLRFFNEAAIDTSVEKIYITLYRVAGDSRIANALISAAKNGKKVIVFVELKARFDEANNIRWSKKMKAAGVQIIESIPGLKVHAKLALVKRKGVNHTELYGLFSTGNFNESTARFYTDHILMTSHRTMLREAEKLFKILKKRKNKKKKITREKYNFHHLLVGQFNLQQKFTKLIDQEISNKKMGLPASIIIKFNNLEEHDMIAKLYEASEAGVPVSLIVRGICCLQPGVKGMSEQITVKRIIDRYLEHGRVFIFHNNNNPNIFLGSADWMIRNIHRRIEVCFPVYQSDLKTEILNMVNIQLKDNVQAVIVDEQGHNVPILVKEKTRLHRSQWEISKMLMAT